jgi:hypothetical protein
MVALEDSGAGEEQCARRKGKPLQPLLKYRLNIGTHRVSNKPRVQTSATKKRLPGEDISSASWLQPPMKGCSTNIGYRLVQILATVRAAKMVVLPDWGPFQPRD